MMFLETSAKTAANVAAVFDAIARQLPGAGGPPSGPSIPALQNAPPPISTRLTSKAQDRSPPPSNAAVPTKQQKQGRAGSSPAAAPATPADKGAKRAAAAGEGAAAGVATKQESASAASVPASGEHDEGSETRQRKLQDPAASLSSTQSATSIASDGASDPLPPSSDANILEPPPVSNAPPFTPGVDHGSHEVSSTSGSRQVSQKDHPADANAGAAASLGAAEVAPEPDEDLPAAPQKAEARSAAPAAGGETEHDNAPFDDDKPGDTSGGPARLSSLASMKCRA